jgi:hypothetical protein
MWHSFLELPLVVRIIASVGGAVLALYTAVKVKAIHAAMKKAIEAATSQFWKWLHEKLGCAHPQDGNQRTYKGIYQDYGYRSTPGPMHFFSVTYDRVTTTVPVLDTHLLFGIKIGTLVDIDTEVRSGYEYEIIRRVRVHHAKKATNL